MTLTEENCQYLSELTTQAINKCKEQYNIEIKKPIKFDTGKTLEKNKALIIQMVKAERDKLLKAKPQIKKTTSVTSRELKKKEAEEKSKAEAEEIKKLKEAEQKIIADWKKQFNPDMIIKSPAYFEMEKYIEMVCGGFANFCIVVSAGGWAKTWSSQAILKKKKEDYAYLNSFTSPLELYNFLYDNSKDKVILIDDTEGIWENKSIISILKNATEMNGKRNISWNSTTSKMGNRTNTCSFTSRIILLTNQLPNIEKNPHIDALINRAFLCRLKFSYREKMDIIKEVSNREYQNLKAEERQMIYAFIERNTSEATNELSIRTLIKCYHFYLFNKQLWKELARKILGVDINKEVVLELMNSKLPVDKQERLYYERTGRSRADFFRVKRELKETLKKKYVKAELPKENVKNLGREIN